MCKPDKRTGTMKLTVAFCNFASKLKKQMHDAVMAKIGTVQSIHRLKTEGTVIQWAKKFNYCL